jgi:hypothetical protein
MAHEPEQGTEGQRCTSEIKGWNLVSSNACSL